MDKRSTRWPQRCLRVAIAMLVATTAVVAISVPNAAGLEAPPTNIFTMFDNQSGEDSQLTVSWDHPASPIAVKSYFLKWEQDGVESDFVLKDYEVNSDGRVVYEFEVEPDEGSVQVKFRGLNQPNSDWGTAVHTDGAQDNIASAASHDSLTVSWTPDVLTLHDSVDKEQLWYRVNGTTGNGSFVLASAGSPHVLDGLAADTDYQVRMRTVYLDGRKSDLTSWIDMSTTADPTPTGGADSLCKNGGSVHDTIGAAEDYPESRVPIESHVWFFPTGEQAGGEDTEHSLGHAHMLTCVPFPVSQGGQAVVSETLDLDIHFVAHLGGAKQFDGTPIDTPQDDVRVIVREIEVRGLGDPGADILVFEEFSDDREECNQRNLGPNDCETFMSCASPESCMESYTVTLDLAEAFATNGAKQLRVAVVHDVVRMEDDGSESIIASMRAIGRSPFDLAIPDREGSVDADPAKNITESSGWLIERTQDGAGGYATVGFDWAPSDGPATSRLSATEPVVQGESFTLDLRFEADPCGWKCAVKYMPLRNYGAFLNPDFHHGTPCGDPSPCRIDTGDGTDWTLVEPPNDPAHYVASIDVDTSTLDVGTNWIMVAVQQPMVDGECTHRKACVNDADPTDPDYNVPPEWASTLTGVLVVYFTVAPPA